MTKIVVLFNLKAGVDAAEYEAWAKTTDLPTVNALDSVDRFDVLRTTGLLMSDDQPPYRYVEIIDINDMGAFGADVSTETLQKVAGEFQQFADSPLFITTQALA